MRYHSVVAAISVSFLTGAGLGYALPERQTANAVPGSIVTPQQPHTRTAEEYPGKGESPALDSLSARMETIHSELRTVKATLDQLSTSVHTYAASLEDKAPGHNATTVSYTANEIADFQNNIFAQLSDPGFNLNTLHGMPEFQKLPEEDKKIVLDELARRLDSGEIDKRTFLPGYNPKSE